MSQYIFSSANRISGKDKFDVEEFNRIAGIYPPIGYEQQIQFVNGDTAIYDDSDWPQNRKYQYSNLFWSLNVISNTFDTLSNGLASTFRENLNNNFEQIKDQADTVEKNLDGLRKKIKSIATSASAADLITDQNHRTVTDAEKNKWNERAIYSTEVGGSNKVYYEHNGQTVDITSALSTFVNTSIPQKTSQLENENNLCILIQKDQYQRPACYHWRLRGGTPVLDPSGQSYTCGDIVFIPATHKCTFSYNSINRDQIPYLMYSEEMLSTGNFSSSCETFTGYISFDYNGTAAGLTNFDADLIVTESYNPYS